MNPMGRAIATVALVGLSATLSGCTSMRTSPDMQTVKHVDLQRYMGDWYVIANIPYFAEKNCVDSLERYSLREDGRIDNTFHCRKKSLTAPLQQRAKALAWVHDTRTNAQWRIRFFGLITTKYLVLGLDDEYRWSAVGHPSRRYGWILARGKQLSQEQYQAALASFEHQGYDVSRFVKVVQAQ